MSFYAFYPPASSGTSSNASVGANGAAAPSSSTEIAGVNPSGNLTPVSVDNAGNVNTNIVGTVPLPTGASTSALQTTGNTSLSTIATQTSHLPTSLGQTTMANSLPVTIASDQSAIPVTGSLSISPTTDTTPATQNVTTQDLASTTTAQANGQNAITGTPTAGSAASFAVTSRESVEVEVTGTWAGTLVSEVSMDSGVTWFTRGLKQSGASYISSSFTAKFQGGLNFTGMTNYRIRATTAMTGTATVLITASSNPASITVSNPLTLRDSTVQSITATIKPASTAALTTDTALVVAISPNTTITSSGTIADPVTGTKAKVNLTGQLQVNPNPTEVFNESFEGGVIDTVNRWNTPVVAGAGTVTQSAALGLTVSVGSGANSAAALSSQPLFPTDYASPLTWAIGFKIEATTIATGNYRFFGLGTQGTSYSTSDPIANGVGFEITTSGVLRAVIYASDALIFSSNLTIPTDGLEHIVSITCQGNFTTWYLDNFSIPVATSQTQAPDMTLLPIRLASLNGVSTTTGTPSLELFGAAVLDSGRNASQISDGTYPWRKTNVDVNSNLATINPDLVVTGAAAQTAIVNNILTTTSGTASTNLTGYKSASVQVVSTGTAGTFIFEGSNDNVNFQTIPVFNQLILTGTPITAAITATASQIVYSFPITTQYVRVRIVTTITGGSIQAFSKFMQMPYSPAITQVAQTTAGNLAVTATVASGTVTTVTTVTSSNTAIPGIIADVASAALTTTTTTATLTPTFGSSYLVNIPVTVVSGTTPTLSVAVQESMDTGTNWGTVYTFPTITATGSYNSPVLTLRGNRVRYIQTVTGTTPSFTRAINRLQSSTNSYTKPTGAVFTDRSGTTSATPSTSTLLAAQNDNRRYFIVQNLSTTAPIYINFTAAADTTTSLQLLPLGSYILESNTITTEAINILSTSASVSYSAKEG